MNMSTERRLSRSFHSCLKGSSTEEAADDEETCYHSLGGRHSLSRHPQVYIEDLSNISLADFETTQDENNGSYSLSNILVKQVPNLMLIEKNECVRNVHLLIYYRVKIIT